MVYRGQEYPDTEKAGGSSFGVYHFAYGGLLWEVEELIEKTRKSFSREGLYKRAKGLVLSQLVCMGKHTLSGLICTSGGQFCDWSATYRLFSKTRIDMECMFDIVRKGVAEMTPIDKPLVVSLDDTLISKKGKKIPWVYWARDPKGPPFAVNFIRAQRFIQASACLPSGEESTPSRMIPIELGVTEKPKKPGRSCDDEEKRVYRALSRQMSLTSQASEMIRSLREKLDCDGEEKRQLVITADGGYTNRGIMKHLPERTTFISRIRKDARLYHPYVQDPKTGAGRKRLYGEQLPTPEELRTDESIPWQQASAYAAGKVHQFRVKVFSPLLWRTAGADVPLVLMVIAPLAYKLKMHGRINYRKPAFIICTDCSMAPEEILQYYIWRWDIEVNFRDEKQLMGMGEAQVRNENSVSSVPAFVAASYAMLLLAGHKAYGNGRIPDALPRPKWYTESKQRLSTKDLVSQLRAELWGKTIGADNFSGFADTELKADDYSCCNTKPEKLMPDLASAVLYA
jgi:hypothetical protein